MKNFPVQRSGGRPYFAGLPAEVKAQQQAQMSSADQFRPLTMAQASRIEPGTMWWTPLQTSQIPVGT